VKQRKLKRRKCNMNEFMRVSPEQVRRSAAAGTLLVCAYDNDEKFQKNRLEGAISLTEFKSTGASLPKDHEIVFYCA
jgi:hypothetical protein